MKLFWLSLAAALAVSTGTAEALPACDQDGVLFVASEAAQQRDVPKSATIRIKLGKSASANFDCRIITQTSMVPDWQDSVGCEIGSPSLVVRWRTDDTIVTACDKPPPPPKPDQKKDEEKDNAN